MCGENFSRLRKETAKAGSSPRVRGKRLKKIFKDAGIGLIPACAGKTASREAASPTEGAHPRVCGENLSPNRSTLI